MGTTRLGYLLGFLILAALTFADQAQGALVVGGDESAIRGSDILFGDMLQATEIVQLNENRLLLPSCDARPRSAPPSDESLDPRIGVEGFVPSSGMSPSASLSFSTGSVLTAVVVNLLAYLPEESPRWDLGYDTGAVAIPAFASDLLRPPRI